MAKEIFASILDTPQGQDPVAWGERVFATDDFRPNGFVFRNGESERVNLKLAYIPVIGATPNPVARILWTTTSSDTANTASFQIRLGEVTESDVLDKGGTWTVSASVLLANNGADDHNWDDVSLSALTLTQGNMLIGYLERDTPSNLAADIIVQDVLFLADS